MPNQPATLEHQISVTLRNIQEQKRSSSNSVWKKNNIKRRVGGKIHRLMKIQTFRNFLSTQYASNLCFSSQASQLTMGKIYKNKKDPHLTLAEKKNNIKRREKIQFYVKIQTFLNILSFLFYVFLINLTVFITSTTIRDATASLSQARPNILPRFFWLVVSYKSVLKPKI